MFFVISLPFVSLSQKHYKIKLVDIGGLSENVYGPHLVGDYLYYCSDKKIKAAKSFVNVDGSRFTDIYRVKVDKNKIIRKTKQRLNDSINTVLSEGSVHFTNDSLLYFNRNMSDNDESNSGIYISKYIDDSVYYTHPFKYNNISYNIVHPTLSEDEKLMIFASDMPGGEGMSDLYYCEFINSEWTEPKNIGDHINTENKESFPYLYKNQLFFSSDREGGFGKKDLYYSSKNENGWSKSIHLKEPFNSTGDDFSIYLIDGLQEGYISSNRKSNLDYIMYFNSKLPRPTTFLEVEPNFCYLYTDKEFEFSKDIELVWNMGDGVVKKGNNINYCYDKIGTYAMSLNIIDHSLGQEYNNIHQQNIEIFTDGMPFIVHEFIDNKHIFYSDVSTCDSVCGKFYWLVDGILKFDKKIEINGLNHEVKYVTWNESEPEKVIGVIKKYD